ncbi:MAG: hypothetical protein BGO05_03945 [Rhizobiales bacterium 63-7]|nr:MAG: hypothetical protein BGO05_03945 [Rhizobiales bacterium 63-7]
MRDRKAAAFETEPRHQAHRLDGRVECLGAPEPAASWAAMPFVNIVSYQSAAIAPESRVGRARNMVTPRPAAQARRAESTTNPD